MSYFLDVFLYTFPKFLLYFRYSKSEVTKVRMIFQQTPVSLSSTEELTETKEDLLEDLKKTRYALEVAYSGFDNVTDPDLIDCYIYQVNAILKRYKFLLEKISAKENELLLNK